MCAAKGIPEIKDIGSSLHIANESFASGTLVLLYSHQTHPYVEAMLTYVIRTLLEPALITSLMERVEWLAPEMMNNPGVKFDRKAIQCMDNLRELQSPFMAFSFGDLTSLFRMLVSSSLFCSIVLLVELIMDKKWRKSTPERPKGSNRTMALVQRSTNRSMLLVHASQLDRRNIRPKTAI